MIDRHQFFSRAAQIPKRADQLRRIHFKRRRTGECIIHRNENGLRSPVPTSSPQASCGYFSFACLIMSSSRPGARTRFTNTLSDGKAYRP